MRGKLRHEGSAIPTALVHTLAGGTLCGSTDDGLSGPAKSNPAGARQHGRKTKEGTFTADSVRSHGSKRRELRYRPARDSPGNRAIVGS